jgi:cytochrome P450/deferrochelatase/peroxidase EfeB
MTSTIAAPIESISHGLNLQLVLTDPTQMPHLMMAIAAKRDSTYAALHELHFVHFARFLPSHDNTALQVITSFDGPLDAYALDFVIAIGDIFDAILSFVKDAPPLPVSEHPQTFLAFVKRNNRVIVAPPALVWDDYPAYSAYPDKTVIEIVGPRKNPPPVRPVTAATVDLSDVQGHILKGYRAHSARHYALRLHDGPAARALLARLLDGDSSAGTNALPQITTAEPWTTRPVCMLNIGFTAQGLQALGMPVDQMTGFSNAFLQGAGEESRANANGDTGASSPEYWEMGGARTEVHLLLSLFAKDDTSTNELERQHQLLLAAFDTHQLSLVHQHDAQAMTDGRVQFGYKDGISQPRLAGVYQPKPGSSPAPDMQPLSSVGEFLLGADYTSVYGGSSLGQMPAALCQNATFAAVRVLDQDVAAFEASLDATAQSEWVDREWVAAKLMGRWRDGRPLLAPPTAAALPMPSALPTSSGCPFGHGATTDATTSLLPTGNSAFDYAPSLAYPNLPSDNDGIGCPVGSHLRRMNPRSSLVAGQPYSRRIIRRGMPYGPVWNPANPNARRGLFGFFICADLERQFEFLTQQWGNGDFAASGIRGTQDPIIGAQTLSGEFTIPMPAGQAAIKVATPRWVTTRGSVYLLMPGMNGLRWLAKGEAFDDAAAKAIGPAQWLSESPAVQTASRLAPAQFDPMDPAFVDNPYPYYALFRKYAPVVQVQKRDYQSFWVLNHELCQTAALDPATFLKQPSSVPLPGRGLFFMDDPQHASARSALDPQFAAAIAAISASAKAKAQEAILSLVPMGSTFDAVTHYANPVLRNIFMDMLGWPAPQWAVLGDLVQTMLQAFNPMLPVDQRTPSYAAAAQIMQMLQAGVAQCPAHGGADSLGLLCRIQGLTQTTPAPSVISPPEAISTGLDFLLGGYLSSVFLASTGIVNLLQHPAAMQAYRSGNAALRANAFEEMKRFDAPFQLADRFASHDMTFGGVFIPKDSLVSLVFGSANHDEAVFGATAEQFDIERSVSASAQNLVFGVGEHRCIGAPMAGQTVPIVIDTLIDSFAHLAALQGMAQRRNDPYFRGFRSLPLRH